MMTGIIPGKKKRPRWAWLIGTLFLSAAILLLMWNFTRDRVDPLTVEERAWLKAHPVIRLAPDPDFPPVEYFDKNGEYNGITKDYVSLIEKKLGVRFKIVRLRDWNEIINKSKSRQIDIYVATKTPQRAEYMLFTKPYLEFPVVIIAREKVKGPLNLEKLNRMKVSAVSEYAAHNFIAYNYPKLNLDLVPDVQTGLRKVSFGMSDAFVENLATASYYIEREAFTNLRVVGESGYAYRMAFASRKDWPVLNRILEKGLAQIGADEKKAMYNKWIPLEPKSLFASKGFQAFVLVFFFAILLLITGITVWNRALRKQVRVRTLELEKELTERKQAEESLRESEEMFRVLAETTPAAIMLYKGEKLVYVNPSATRLTGYTEREFLEMRFWDWMHEDFKEQVRSYGLARQRGEQVPAQYEAKCVTKCGEEKWIFISAGRIEYKGTPAGIVSIFDITARKRAEESLRTLNEELESRVAARTTELAVLNANLLQEIDMRKQIEEELRENKEKYQAMIDTFDGWIYVCSADYRIEFMNKGFINRTGCVDTGGYCYKVLHGRDSACPWCANEPAHEGKTSRWEYQNPYDKRWYYVVSVPFYRADGSISRQTMATDITERKMAEEQLKRQKQMLEELNCTLEKRVQEEVEKNREKDIMLIQQNRQAALGEMLDHIAHQWKQPLNAISFVVQDLESTWSCGELTDGYIDETVHNTINLLEHMVQTIEVFRDFYRPDKEKTVFLIKDSIDRALSFIAPALRFQAIAVELDIDPDLSATGFPKEYTQVLLNILTNARDAFKERKTESPSVKIRAFAEGNKAVVTITDNAGGIPEEIIGKIFEMYFTTREARGGSGIGLYMSKNIIEKNMMGKLSAANVGGGAQFRIELNMPGC